MKFSEQWLREWVNPAINVEKLISQLTMAGNEVEAYSPVAGEFNEVIVALVTEAMQHPNAERLQLCKVDTGQEVLDIVCGGKNVRAGLKVALAKIDARLPNNIHIKKTKIRGTESFGMICSLSELGLGESEPGFIMELPDDAPVGQDFRDYLKLNDHSIELSLTPNRGDCLSIRGIAREVAAINDMPLSDTTGKTMAPTMTATVAIELKNPEACSHYVGRVIQNINPKAKSPLWLQERLRRSDIRSISPVVDVTNYVMLELGQPLHAFDLEKIASSIEVRFARDKEKLLLLNDVEVALSTDTLIIADKNSPLAIAGVMGGATSGINENTQHIFLESAYFSPQAIAGKARKYGIYTDSSHRFERGVDPALQVLAIERATELLLKITGGEAGPLCEEIADKEFNKTKIIYLRAHKIAKHLGLLLDKNLIVNLLQRLHFKVESFQEGWNVTVPSFRFDVNEEVDLLEEIARIYGYDNIPLQQPSQNLLTEFSQEKDITIEQIVNRLQHLGYHQLITYSFIDPKLQQLLYPDDKFLTLANPIASDMAAMRLSLLPGLLNAVIYNQNRQQTRLRFFETGQRFLPLKDEIVQDHLIGGIAIGSAYPEQWGMPAREVDFFDVKGDVENLLALSGCHDYQFVRGHHPCLHPTQSALIEVKGKTVGYIGILAPQLCQMFNLNSPIVFEIACNALKEKTLPRYEAIAKFPSVRRDLALVVNENISAAELNKVISETAGALLQEIIVFDVYTGKNVQNGKKSVAIGLILQSPQRTLVDDEVNQLIDKIVLKLKETYQATLR